MVKRLLIGLVVVGVLAGAGVGGVLLYLYVSGGSGEASRPVAAQPIAAASAAALVTQAPAALPSVAATPATPTEPAKPAVTAVATAAPSAPPSPAPTTAAAVTSTATAAVPTPATQATAVLVTASPTTAAPVPPASRTFRIDPAASEVRYLIDEILRGSPNTVVGRTNQVGGEIAINFQDAAKSQLGVIEINVRTFRTDSELRDRTVRSRVLQSAEAQFELVRFKPTAIAGLPTTVALGMPVNLQITGDLTIRTVTKPVTFAVAVTAVSADRLEGKASTTIRRADFNLTIPEVPNVAGVSETVKLEIDFVAPAV